MESAMKSVDNAKSQEDKTRQNKSKSRRVKTLFKKAKELQDATGCQVFVYVKDQYNHVKFGGSSNLSSKFKQGQLSLEAAKKKEINFQVVHPRPTVVRHLKSMWPGTVSDEEASCSTNNNNETFVEEGSSIEGDSVEELTTEEEDTEEEYEDGEDSKQEEKNAQGKEGGIYSALQEEEYEDGEDSKQEGKNAQGKEGGMGEEESNNQKEEGVGDEGLEGWVEETETDMDET
ncbi:hypothetical protein HOLleu_43112 [Holothuria leucospilota]|uniref:MADS-box domain-containing protein n=1 Tax=Holothuria leucospilota TaxID=206669 RepID=A0A9Q0YB01_HOLLE|nr:hypothetical protein HOLleu_43112 [Holothuria leucospilota]